MLSAGRTAFTAGEVLGVTHCLPNWSWQSIYFIQLHWGLIRIKVDAVQKAGDTLESLVFPKDWLLAQV